jgi:nucleoid-associated protein YgaU
MPNDAKLGLVVGVALVIAVAVLFFRKEAPAEGSAGEAAPAGIVRPIPPAPLPGGPVRTASAHPTAETKEAPSTEGARRHTVCEGDTLFSLARSYYGHPERFGLIYDANRDVLHEPDPLPVGAVLVIPEPPAEDQSGSSSR